MKQVTLTTAVLMGVLALRMSSGLAMAQAPLSSLPGNAPGRSAVEALIETNPTTPSQMLQAVNVCANLGDDQVARHYLQQLLASSPSQSELAGLVDEFGSAVMATIGMNEDLLPEGRQFVRSALNAYEQQQTDPVNLQRWVSELGDSSGEARYRAYNSLRSAQEAAVPYLVMALADDSQSDLHPAIRSVFQRMEGSVGMPLVAMLESDDPAIVRATVQAMADSRSRRQAAYLLSPYLSQTTDPVISKAAADTLSGLLGQTPDEWTAANLLMQESQRNWDQQNPLGQTVQSEAPWWSWDDQQKQLTRTYSSTDEQYRRLAARMSRDAMKIAPEDAGIRQLYIATQLEERAYELGLDSPMPIDDATVVEVLSNLGVRQGISASVVAGDLQQALVYAIHADHPVAATAIVNLLGQTGDTDRLLTTADAMTPLVHAARSHDRRLRFTAVQAIANLDPTISYSGSSDVYKAMLDFAGASGSRRAIVAGPVNDAATHIAGSLIPLGYEPTTAGTGREIFAEAVRMGGDCEMILMDSRTLYPELEIFVQQFRQDNRTAGIPIGIIARADQLARAEKVAARDPLTITLIRPHNEETIRWGAEQVTGLVDESAVPSDVRLQQAIAAIEWLNEAYTDTGRAVYRGQPIEEVAIAALDTPELRPTAIQILGKLGTPKSQTALIDLASRFGQSLADRQAAADAFYGAADRSGVMLTRPQILAQYDRYNSSQHDDPETQQLLGSILDWFESRMN